MIKTGSIPVNFIFAILGSVPKEYPKIAKEIQVMSDMTYIVNILMRLYLYYICNLKLLPS